MDTTHSPSTTHRGDSQGRNDDQARRIAEHFAAASKIPGMSIAVAGPEGTLYADATGYADIAAHRGATIEDQYPWFSMTKIATATAAMQLHAQGQLDLDDPIGTYLHSYQPHSTHGHPTTRQLLTHTAGLVNPLPIRWVRPEGDPEDPALHARIVSRYGTPRKPVGARAAYSNIGYLLVGDVMEAATGRTVQDCVTDTVLRPLAMHRTGYTYQPNQPRSNGYVRLHPALAPALRWVLPSGLVGHRVEGHSSLRPFLVSGAAYGGLIGNVIDAAKLAAAHVAGGADTAVQLGGADLQRMRRITAGGKPFDHGIGWFRRRADAQRSPAFVEHYGFGGGFWNAMRIYPRQQLAMVAMTNTTFKWDVDGLFTQLVDLPWH